MPYSEYSLELMKKETETEMLSNGISNYMLDGIKVNTESIYPADPSIKYQNSGLYKNTNSNFMDINSELLNITRPLTKDQNKKFVDDSIIETAELNDKIFSSKYTRLDEPAFELRGQTKNRWIELPIDPQQNVIEPFKRLGLNTHIALVDNYKC
jgi:hypothetical protein